MADKTRQERIDNGTLVPNSFQHPNLYVDWLHFYLTPSEVVVLDKAIREILGWEDNISDRKARIALSIFHNGKTSRKTGQQLCLGCGLGLHTIRAALVTLHQYNILVKDGPPTQDGQMYRLQDKTELIDWDGLEQRRNKSDKANKKRTEAATDASLESRSLTLDVRGNVERNTSNLCSGPEQDTTSSVASDVRVTSDVPPDLTSNVNKETQKNLYTNETIEDDLSSLWSPVLDSLALTMTKATFDTWFRGSRLITADNGTWTVEVHGYAVDWIENRLQKPLNRAMAQHAPGIQVEFIGRETP